MIDLLIFSLTVFVMSFFNSASISSEAVDTATQLCSSNARLKSIAVEEVFGKKSYAALCGNGVKISFSGK